MLRGELHRDQTGGDRNFLKTNDSHAAEFLRVVWESENNERAIFNWVVNGAKGLST